MTKAEQARILAAPRTAVARSGRVGAHSGGGHGLPPWAAPRASSSVGIEAPPGGLSKYSWKRRIRSYFRCKRCGRVTHYKYRN